MVEYLTIVLFAIWGVSEIVISLISLINQARGLSEREDQLSFFILWSSTVPPVWFAILIRAHLIFTTGFGSLSTLSSLLGYLGCFFIALGVTIRLVAVATLKRQFTVRVAIVEKHEIVETGIYGILRHPAYLGHLASLLGIGLASGNWISLLALVVLPLAAILYRIRVEEKKLLHHFGPAYQAYASRTKRLLPGIW